MSFQRNKSISLPKTDNRKANNLRSTHRQFKASMPCHALNWLGQVKAGAPVSLSVHYLYDERRATGHNFSRDLRERAVFNAHDLQVGAVGQLVGQAVQLGVVVDVQGLQILQRTCKGPSGEESQNPGSLLCQYYRMYSILQGTCCRTLFKESVQDKVEKRVSSLFSMYATMCATVQETCARPSAEESKCRFSPLSALHNV